MIILFNSILVNKLIFDNYSDDVMFECMVFDEVVCYDFIYYLLNMELNVLFCELFVCEIEIDFELYMK